MNRRIMYMVFEKEYFEDEVRDGFYVPAQMKHAWAAQLEVLNDIDKACTENEIQYFAEWGTLLGAVRHHGFIPWDDDMDICMKRADYEKFLRIYDKIMPENYTIYNITTDTETDDFLSRVINGRSINFDKIHLEKYHGFPYSAGIDIFPLDFIAPDEDDDKYQREVIAIVNTLAKTIRGMQEDESLMTEEAIADVKEDVKHIEKLCNITIDEDADLVQQLNILVDRLCGLYTEDESEYITLMPLWLDVNGIWRDGERYRFPKDYYTKTVRLPFENTTIPVPYAYDKILKKKYGDYKQFVHEWGTHDYPFYERQIDILKREDVTISKEFECSMQEYEAFKQQKNTVRTARSILRQVNDENNTDKKTVVFMPYKSKYWENMEALWKEYSDNDEYNVVVIPLPYYYKNFDGTADYCEDKGTYPDYVELTTYENYRFEQMNPEKIIIQNPYDEFNMTVTVHPAFYSRNLAIHTDELIYMPYFKTEEIDENDMRAYKWMKEYVTMPGVVYADKVIVQSENIKKLYVKKLTEFLGEDLQKEWDNKITY
ncbi:hypothetical protein DW044_11475 [Lachnospira eligens]|nr:hypothetical protein DW044_11475 [Lachnospira eligens]